VEYTQDQVDLIKRTVCKGASDDELQMFLSVAQRTGLDPFTKQIYAVRRWDKKAGREVMIIQVGIDGMRATADRTGCYSPGRETAFEYDSKGKLFKATAYVLKCANGHWHETAESAHFAEYYQDSAFWNRMPHVMLAKCAEARALRRCFPMQLGQTFIPEEMVFGNVEDAQAGDDGQAAPKREPRERLKPAEPPAAQAKPTVADLGGPSRITKETSFPISDELNDMREKALKEEYETKKANAKRFHELVNDALPGEANKEARASVYASTFGLGKKKNAILQFLDKTLEEQERLLRKAEEWHAVVTSDVPEWGSHEPMTEEEMAEATRRERGELRE
jgi:phage recombination protein Bet